jgi:hypothetical protein
VDRRIKSLEKFPIGNRTCDLLCSGPVPQPTAPPLVASLWGRGGLLKLFVDRPEAKGSRFFRNVCSRLPVNTALYPVIFFTFYSFCIFYVLVVFSFSCVSFVVCQLKCTLSPFNKSPLPLYRLIILSLTLALCSVSRRSRSYDLIINQAGHTAFTVFKYIFLITFLLCTLC